MLIAFSVERPNEEGVLLRWGNKTMWKFYLSWRFEEFVEY